MSGGGNCGRSSGRTQQGSTPGGENTGQPARERLTFQRLYEALRWEGYPGGKRSRVPLCLAITTRSAMPQSNMERTGAPDVVA